MRIETAPTAVFHENASAERVKLVGWMAPARALNISAPVRSRVAYRSILSAAATGKTGTGTFIDQRYWPGGGLANHLTFAPRHENIDLLTLKPIVESCRKPSSKCLTGLLKI